MAWLAEKNAARAVNGGWGCVAVLPPCCRWWRWWRLLRGLIVLHNIMLCDTLQGIAAGWC